MRSQRSFWGFGDLQRASWPKTRAQLLLRNFTGDLRAHIQRSIDQERASRQALTIAVVMLVDGSCGPFLLPHSIKAIGKTTEVVVVA